VIEHKTETAEDLQGALWVVETSQSGGTILHGPFDARASAAHWATEVLLNRSMEGSRTVAIRPMYRPTL
jgi:hypothetical protein